MRALFTRMLLLLLMGTSCAWAEERPAPASSAQPGPEDMKIIAMMEMLQMMDMTEEMEMIKDLEYLIEDNQDEPEKE